MAQYFKAGQLLPRRMLTTHKKTRVNVRFGCDVVIEGDVIYPAGASEKSVIYADVWKGRRRKNGTIQRVRYEFKKFSIDFSTSPGGSGVRVIL